MTRRAMRRLWAVSAVVAGATAAWAGPMATVRVGSGLKPAAPAPKADPAKPPTGYVAETKAPPTIDGRLTERAWSASQVLKVTRTLDGSGRARQATEIRLLRDAKRLYIGIRCEEPFTDKMRATRRTRDEDLWGDDGVEIFLGTADDWDYYHIIVNSLGAIYDGFNKDKSWNGAIEAAGAVDERQWSAEVAVGLAELVFPLPAGKPRKGTEVKRWIANFNRNRYTRGGLKELSWSPTFSGNSHVPRRFGRLLFEDPPKELLAAQQAAPKASSRVTFLTCRGGQAVVRFDLSGVPAGATVHRADLVARRTGKVTGRDEEVLVDIAIYPLAAGFEAGGSPEPAGEALKLRGPWFDRFDATAAVAKAVAAKASQADFFVKAFPLWDRESTYLQVAYAGRPERVPPPATGLKAVHRSGQTFLTWREIALPEAAGKLPEGDVTWGELRGVLGLLDAKNEVRYCIYRHTSPITAESLRAAELIARVRPLSCWNVNGRNIEKPIDAVLSGYALIHHQWNPFVSARVDGKYGLDCVMERLAIADGGGPLARGTGLYVHTSREEGRFHYAVVTQVDGVQNTTALSAANSLAAPVAEAPAEPEPVRQKALPRRPYWNYPETRHHYVRWVGPPYANVPTAYYNWAVAVPTELGKSIKGKVPLELSLHRDGKSYYITQYRIRRDSIVVCPHDFPLKTWWSGYHEAEGTLKSFRQGVVHPYTERRVLWFMEWASKTWPVDPARTTVTGMNGGASYGARRLRNRHPKLFSRCEARGRSRAADIYKRLEVLWGRPEWKLKGASGRSVWDE